MTVEYICCKKLKGKFQPKALLIILLSPLLLDMSCTQTKCINEIRNIANSLVLFNHSNLKRDKKWKSSLN